MLAAFPQNRRAGRPFLPFVLASLAISSLGSISGQVVDCIDPNGANCATKGMTIRCTDKVEFAHSPFFATWSGRNGAHCAIVDRAPTFTLTATAMTADVSPACTWTFFFPPTVSSYSACREQWGNADGLPVELMDFSVTASEVGLPAVLGAGSGPADE